jgi:arginyl-tRNA synthetase
MSFEQSLKNKLQNVLKSLGIVLTLDDIVIEHSKDKAHGDFATNIALKYSKELHKSPKEIAEIIKNEIDMEGLEKVEIAGPGFINFFISNNSLSSIIEKVINEDENFGRSIKANKKVNVEFVSANPTGDLHLGHARCAAVGDSICRIYDFAGFEVTREFYVNDAGSQINHLRDSIRARYHSILGDET